MTLPQRPELSAAGQAVIRDLHPRGDVDDPGPVEPPDDGGGDGEELDGQVEEQLREERAIGREVDALRRRQVAQQRLIAESLPPLRALPFGDFLAMPGVDPLVHGLFYRESLSRVYGPPGGGKSMFLLDLAFRVALSWQWGEHAIDGGSVIFVMAEGQRVNRDRARAWLDFYATSAERLDGRFIAVPDAVLLTEDSARPLVQLATDVQPAMIILDTKNAMMIGEENSATDFAVLRRVLDQLRNASGACVVLVDHTGHDSDRPRGSSAGTGAMDTEIRVRQTDRGLVEVRVTRDKADEDGFTRDFRIIRHDDQPILRPAAGPSGGLLTSADTPVEDRDTPETPAERVQLPDDVLAYTGGGAQAARDLAELFAREASPDIGDPGRVGMTRVEATHALADRHSKSTVIRAWSALLAAGHITAAEHVRSPTGRHLWTPKP